MGRQEGGVTPHVSRSALAPSTMSVPVRGSVRALSLVLALSAALTPAPLVLALSLVSVLTLTVSLALLFLLALTVILVQALVSVLASTADSVPVLFPSMVPALSLQPRLWL